MPAWDESAGWIAVAGSGSEMTSMGWWLDKRNALVRPTLSVARRPLRANLRRRSLRRVAS